ncbi:DUF4145 domain-containing protein [Polyangium spumosum]|uniref:DUF4145 domain-containing protein n=1 Tax=Polyangium spumosum TaxID=889282 RepID=A0A6N7PE27_9BACT|nr:DUF4145 domain-containing protein [Polyangium spumosum]MRG90313.1 DUF4145 domain-containing protein [Polyangium spumosum]
MPLTPQIDKDIRARFKSLQAKGTDLVQRMKQEVRHNVYDLTSFGDEYFAFRTSCVTLIEYLSHGSGRLANVVKEIYEQGETYLGARALLGIICGLSDDYDNGLLDSMFARMEAEIAADYLGQAEALLKEGQPGKHDHVPAAVLIGAILEKTLRDLCRRQSPPIPLVTPAGGPKMLNGLIDELKKAGVFNELRAKQLRHWADVRNAAAHGDFEKFTRADVDSMLSGVGQFLADYS